MPDRPNARTKHRRSNPTGNERQLDCFRLASYYPRSRRDDPRTCKFQETPRPFHHRLLKMNILQASRWELTVSQGSSFGIRVHRRERTMRIISDIDRVIPLKLNQLTGDGLSVPIGNRHGRYRHEPQLTLAGSGSGRRSNHRTARW